MTDTLSLKQLHIKAIPTCRELIRKLISKSFYAFCIFFVWIEDKERNVAIKFVPWPSQLRILKDLLVSPRLIILKARQLGLTWMCAMMALWLCIFKPLQLVVVISAKEEWAIEFLDRVQFMLARLPSWLHPKVVKSTGQHLKFQHAASTFSEIKSLATTEEGAQSKTPTLLILDETARNRYVKSIYASSKPGIDAAGGRIIIISNSHKGGNGWGWTKGIYVKSMQGLNDFTRIFMPWWDRPERPADFKERQLREGMDEDDFSENYPETEQEAVSSTIGSFFGKTLSRHNCTATGTTGYIAKDSVTGELAFMPDKKGILEIWRYPIQLTQEDDMPWVNRYCIGSDVSEGLGKSYSVAYVLDRLKMEFVARIRSNRVDAYEWGKMLNVLSEFYNSALGSAEASKEYNDVTGSPVKALKCIETTGAGQTTVKYLKENGGNLYVQLVTGVVGKEITKRYGWHESNQAKHELSGDLKEYFKKTGGSIFCAYLLEEAGTWIRHDNGKIGPESDDKFGDCVIAAGCTIQADIFIGEAPYQLKQPLTGWRKEQKERGNSAWVK